MTVNVLGTPYTLEVKQYDEQDQEFSEYAQGGYCNFDLKRIVLCDLATHPSFKDAPQEQCEARRKVILRHEIIHAFFNESGLRDNAFKTDYPWPMVEEMVDWWAIQGPKVYQAWKEAEAV